MARGEWESPRGTQWRRRVPPRRKEGEEAGRRDGRSSDRARSGPRDCRCECSREAAALARQCGRGHHAPGAVRTFLSPARETSRASEPAGRGSPGVSTRLAEPRIPSEKHGERLPSQLRVGAAAYNAHSPTPGRETRRRRACACGRIMCFSVFHPIPAPWLPL